MARLAAIACAVAASLLFYRRVMVSDRRIDGEVLGIRGERVVAEALEDLRRDGYHVFHDLPPERDPASGMPVANFDHAIVGPAGLFVIETKTLSKRDVGRNEIRVTASREVLISGYRSDPCPLAQAQTLARAMQRTLERETGLAGIPVRAVVVFQGWWIDDHAYRQAGGDVWTLNESAFAKWVRSPKEGIRLRPDEIALIASRLDRQVRSP